MEAGLDEPMRSVNRNGLGAAIARLRAEKAMIVPRVAVRFAENAIERAIRQVEPHRLSQSTPDRVQCSLSTPPFQLDWI